MGKKRKSEDTHLDEADRTIYSVFRGAANSLSLIYTQAMAQQELAFQTGERHALVFLLYRFLSRNFFASVKCSRIGMVRPGIIGIFMIVMEDWGLFGFQENIEMLTSEFNDNKSVITESALFCFIKNKN